LQLVNRLLTSSKVSKRALLRWCEDANDRERALESVFEQLSDWIMDRHPGAMPGTNDGWNPQDSDSDEESEGHDTVN